MKLHGLQTHDPSLALLQVASVTDSNVNITEHTDVATFADLYVERASLIHDPSQNFRPSVRLDGEIRRIMPASSDTELGYGISDIVYDPGYGIRMSGFYEFTDDQLQVMVGKGYFTDSFTEPEVMMNNTYAEMPVVSTINIVHPDTADQMPAAIVQVKNVDSLSFTFNSCGYDLSENFPDISSSVRTPEMADPSSTREYQIGESNLSHDVLAGVRYEREERSSYLDLSGQAEQSQDSAEESKNPFDEIVELLDVREMLAVSVDDAAMDELREIYEQRIKGAQARQREQMVQQASQPEQPVSQDQQPSQQPSSHDEPEAESQDQDDSQNTPATAEPELSQEPELTDSDSMAQFIDVFAENPIFRDEEDDGVESETASKDEQQDMPSVRRSSLQVGTRPDAGRQAQAQRRVREQQAVREDEADRGSEPEL